MKKKLSLLAVIGVFGAVLSSQAQTRVEPMLTTSWHQKTPFNNECPSGSAAGCGAIAVAQIMNYYKMPAHGFGHVVYDNVDVDFEARSFDWANIRDRYPAGGYSSTEAQAVASLVFQVGAAMKMKYDTSSSTRNYASMMWGLQHYLHFSPKSRYRHRRYYSTAEWIEMLDNELESGRPVFYRGDHTAPGNPIAGHIYVIDGRDSEGHYHVNFGHDRAREDKFADLNYLNQGVGAWAGTGSVSYHHRQAMVTDFYPVEGLTDSDYDRSAVALHTAIVLGGQPQKSVVEVTRKVHAQFQIRYVSFVVGRPQLSLGFFQGDELVSVAKTVFNPGFSEGGNRVQMDHDYTLPTHLDDGDYVMSIVTRDDDESPWVRGWDNAPNRIPVSVKNDVYTFHMPSYHNQETRLYLTDSEIAEVADGKTDGKTLELTVCNSSDNNFEDSLRLVVKAGGKEKLYEMATSIYEGQNVTYRFFVADSDIVTRNGYAVEAFYKETSTGEWVLLQNQAAGVSLPTDVAFSGVEVWTLNGQLIRRISHDDLEASYSIALSSLPKGVYIIRDKNGTRRFVKRL